MTASQCGVEPASSTVLPSDTADAAIPEPDAGQGLDAGQAAASDAGNSGSSLDAGAPSIRVLFDAAHKNSVGNADWVLDSQSPDPSPAHPTSESQWSGGISAWGFGLHTARAYQVKQLPSGTSLAYGTSAITDLSRFDVFISDEPEQNFTAAESAALMQFATAGGGIFLVTDHSGASRCSSCTEAWRVVNTFLLTGANGAFGVKADGNTIGSSGLTGTPASGALAASSVAGGGRLVLLGDSSPTDDGTCSGCGATLYDGWGEVDNAAVILNATAWLAHDGP